MKFSEYLKVELDKFLGNFPVSLQRSVIEVLKNNQAFFTSITEIKKIVKVVIHPNNITLLSKYFNALNGKTINGYQAEPIDSFKSIMQTYFESKLSGITNSSAAIAASEATVAAMQVDSQPSGDSYADLERALQIPQTREPDLQGALLGLRLLEKSRTLDLLIRDNPEEKSKPSKSSQAKTKRTMKRKLDSTKPRKDLSEFNRIYANLQTESLSPVVKLILDAANKYQKPIKFGRTNNAALYKSNPGENGKNYLRYVILITPTPNVATDAIISEVYRVLGVKDNIPGSSIAANIIVKTDEDNWEETKNSLRSSKGELYGYTIPEDCPVGTVALRCCTAYTFALKLISQYSVTRLPAETNGLRALALDEAEAASSTTSADANEPRVQVGDCLTTRVINARKRLKILTDENNVLEQEIKAKEEMLFRMA